MLQAALKRNGHNVTDDEEHDIAVHIVTPEMFIPIPEKFNVLYTMYECTTLPADWIEPLQHPDLIVVPCAQNKMLFSNYTNVPIEVCNEGVEVDKFKYVDRSFPLSGRFVWLWVGASNPRKGYQHAITAWGHFNNKHPELAGKILLYMKTTQLAGGEHIAGYKRGKPVMEEMPRDRIFAAGNVRIDTRKVPFEGKGGLIDMYQKAHGFLFPTMGEGFGLTLAEAMSTGLPCIYTPWSGPVDFCSPNEAFPLKFSFAPVHTAEILPDGTKRPKHTTYAAAPSIRSIIRQMERVYYDYENALKRGVKAAARIRKDITWDISANHFAEIITRRWNEWGNA